MPDEENVVKRAHEEAGAILAEANEQARRLLEAAEARRRRLDAASEEVRQTGKELAGNLERSIELLTAILEELRSQIRE